MRDIILPAALLVLLAGGASACPVSTRAALAPLLLADNAATSTPAPGGSPKAPDTAAFPNSPNGSPAAGNKGQPVVTDKAACTGTGPTATCPDSPKPSNAADTSDVRITTPTTVDGSAPKP
jgi:hypothetical protein